MVVVKRRRTGQVNIDMQAGLEIFITTSNSILDFWRAQSGPPNERALHAPPGHPAFPKASMSFRARCPLTSRIFRDVKTITTDLNRCCL
jgi:hypothetical protein